MRQKIMALVLMLNIGWSAPLLRAQDKAWPNQSQRETKTAEPAHQPCSVCDAQSGPLVQIIDARPGYVDTGENAENKVNKVKETVSFKRGDKVRVVLTNMNPFNYEYTVKINDTPVAETALPFFFSQIVPLVDTAQKAAANFSLKRNAELDEAPRTPAVNKLPNGDPQLSASCKANPRPDGEQTASATDENFKEAKDALTYLQRQYDDLSSKVTKPNLKKNQEKLVDSFESVASAYVKAFKHIVDPLVACKDLHEAIIDFAKQYDALTSNQSTYEKDVKTLLKSASELTAQADNLISLIEDFRAVYPSCVPKLQGLNYLSFVERYAQSLKGYLTVQVTTPLEQLQTDRESYKELGQAVELVLKHEKTLLRQEYEIGGYDVPTNVTILVERKPTTLIKRLNEKGKTESNLALFRSFNFNKDVASAVNALLPMKTTFTTAIASTGKATSSEESKTADTPAAPAAALQQRDLNFGGGARFSVSGGLVFSRLVRQDYGAVVGIARNRNNQPVNGDTLTNIAGLKENSAGRVGPLLMLNTRLYQKPSFGLHGSFGVTGKQDNVGTDIEYFFGPSLSFLNNKVFFTVGPYMGKRQRLAGDLYEGAKLLEGNAVPIVKEYGLNLGLGFTYKIK